VGEAETIIAVLESCAFGAVACSTGYSSFVCFIASYSSWHYD
jgi:hypothetical protein